ncbi:2Fe-2S iron-sulfur cluster binding domain-containing protein [Escherichia coli]|nr:2Fe-2S iron-sulfur cluster binding domain-containing protein [Escherichia coli]
MTTFHSLTVAKVEPETRDAVTITFAVPQPLQEAYRFRPGQHLTLKASFDGEELRRCYSICRSYLPGEISVAVLAIAAGSGITPMLAIIATTLQTEPESQFTLIYGNRTSQSMMFRQALADLKDKYPQRLQLLCIFSQETLDSDLLHGRIDGEKLQSLGASLINFRLYDEAFICGPAAMMDETEAALKALGMPDKTIHLERFNTPGTRVKRSVNVQSDGQKVTVRQDGRDREIVLNADDESILDAALRQGADLPYACKGGVCATCKCKVLRGKVAMETNYSLEPDELAAGYVLSCQALPLTSDVVVDFDAKGMA